MPDEIHPSGPIGPGPEPIGPPPDRMTIWPIEDGTFGLDATFQGASGYRNAEMHEAVLQLRDVPCSVRQELDGGWTVRLGPLPRALVEHAVAFFIGGPYS